MEYTTQKLASLSGVSARTLRYYDEIGLLSPKRTSSSGYRIYGRDEVDKLQQILLYRAMGVSLETIGSILSSKDFDREKALNDHLLTLLQEKKHIELLISNVEETLKSMKGEREMSDKNKFKGLKESLVAENEAKYGDEARKKYGDKAVDESNARILAATEEDWSTKEGLEKTIAELLRTVTDAESENAKRLFEAHKAWLGIFWGKGMYSPEAHKNLAEMYVADERFKKYYDDIAPGGAELLKNVICTWCNK